MIYIAQELERISTLIGATYCRAASLDEGNILTHYNSAPGILVAYTGFGEVSQYYEGAQPLQSVSTEGYILQLQTIKDELAETKDILLAATSQAAADIIYKFIVERDIIAYKLQPVTVFDDLFIGHLLTFEPIIEGDTCTPTP